MSIPSYTKVPRKHKNYNEAHGNFCAASPSIAMAHLRKRRDLLSQGQTTSKPGPEEASSPKGFDKSRKENAPRKHIGRGHTPSFYDPRPVPVAGKARSSGTSPSTTHPLTHLPSFCDAPPPIACNTGLLYKRRPDLELQLGHLIRRTLTSRPHRRHRSK